MRPSEARGLQLTSDPRYPPVSRAAGLRTGSAADLEDRRRIAALVPARQRRLHLICPRPIHHALELSRLYRICEELRRQAPGIRLDLWLRSALLESGALAELPAESVRRLPEDHESEGLRGACARLKDRRESCLLLGSDEALPADVVAELPVLGTVPFGFRGPSSCSERADAACSVFYDALARASPTWHHRSRAAEAMTTPSSFLVHQSRFRLGDSLWLSPLLRNIRRFFPSAKITVVGSAPTSRALGTNPHVDELVIYDPSAGEAEHRRLIDRLRREHFDVALFAFVRRPKSRWLAEVAAELGIPVRVNLEYFDRATDGRACHELFTHEAWFFWGTLASPRLLLHALSPLIGSGATEWLQDRAVEFPLRDRWRRQAETVLLREGIGDAPFVLMTPGGKSSQKWPAGSYAALAGRITEEENTAVIVDGGPEDGEVLRQVGAELDRHRRSAPAQERPVVLARNPLGVMTALLERAAVLVSNDSAPIHLAEALGTPTLYFTQHEKLTHSHPDGEACWALFDDTENSVAGISVDEARRALREMPWR